MPGRLALRHGARSVMYDELNRRSNRLAHALLGQLTGEDATILLLLRDPIHHVVAQLGVVKTGRACVPVDVSFPLARQRQITADSAARLVVAELETLESALGLGYERGSVVIADDLDPAFRKKTRACLFPRLTGLRALHLRLDGKSKGNHAEPAKPASRRDALSSRSRLGPTDRITSPTSPAYTGTLWALLAALMNGAAFVFTALDSVAAFVETLDKEKITVAQLIVSLLRQVTQSFDERVRLPGLRLIYTGGETLRGQDVGAAR